jgi:IPT/TIG domain-containing protein
MGIYKADGTRVTKDAFPAVEAADPMTEITEDLYDTRPYGRGDGTPEGSIRTILARAGDVMRQSYIDRLFIQATIDAISPNTGAAAGGTVVTITGENLDGVSGVDFGGVAGTNLVIDSAEQLRVTTPAGAAGAADVVVHDDAGDVTVTGGFTYA